MKRYAQYSQIINVCNQPVQAGLSYVDLLYQGGKIVFHEVTEQESGRLDLIAYKYFSDWTVWPLIAWYNGLLDPILGCQMGTILEIPLNSINQQTDIISTTYQGVA